MSATGGARGFWILPVSQPSPYRRCLLPGRKPCQVQDGDNLVLRQSGEVDGGHLEHIYAVDTRHSVRLQFYPDGYEWSDAEPVLISQGFSSSGVRRTSLKTSDQLPRRRSSSDCSMQHCFSLGLYPLTTADSLSQILAPGLLGDWLPWGTIPAIVCRLASPASSSCQRSSRSHVPQGTTLRRTSSSTVRSTWRFGCYRARCALVPSASINVLPAPPGPACGIFPTQTAT